ncbi:MAG: efflux RND transporter periplasmic adaptor subunit [Acidobacteria bacterium]|nr:efflux RND transporter periplasmic adaptor subunit [Acidobacteriota bacterium]
MKKKSLGLIVIVGLIATVFLVSFLKSGKEKGKEVYAEKVGKRDIVSTVSASGVIEPKVRVNISSSVIGRVSKLAVAEGDYVKKGDFLLQIDPQRYQAQVRSAEANLRMAKIGVERAKVDLDNAKINLERTRSLYERGFASKQDLEQAELRYQQAKVELDSAEERVRQAQAQLDQAKDELSKTTFYAPMSGVVAMLNVEEGETVITGTMNNPGTVIMMIADMSEVLATVNVDETDVTAVKMGQKATVEVDAVEGKKYLGKVVDIASSATKEGDVSVFKVKILLEKPDARLRPGMTAHAKIETRRREQVLAVPIQSVVEREVEVSPGKKEKREVVFVVEKGVAKMKEVKTDISDASYVAILSGIKEGDMVITGPYRTLKGIKDGDPVTIKKKEEEGKKGQSVQVKVE